MKNFNKSIVAGAITAALGLTATSASAVGIQSLTLEDIDGDGAVSGFRFITFSDISFPTGVPGTFPNDLTFGGASDDCGGGAGSCVPATFGTEIGTNVFTSGFNFGGGGDFAPSISNSTGTGQLAGDITGGALDLTGWDFAGVYPSPGGVKFFLDADDLTGTLPDPAYNGTSSNGAVNYYLDSLVDNGDGTFGIIMRFSSLIDQPDAGSFNGQIARWRIEGTLNAIPVPAAVWLFGSGLLGLVGVARRKKSALAK